jgi:hypothetical protein
MGSNARPAVLHLVGGRHEPLALRAFLASYREHDAGIPHELLILLSGVRDATLRAQLLAEIGETPHRLIELDEPFDLPAYQQVAATLEHPHVCVLNSHSRILAPGWLAALERPLRDPGVGLVGASGSWASMRSYALYHLGLPSAYRRVWTDRPATLSAFRALDADRTGAPPLGALARRFYTTRALVDMAIGFSPFPAPHIRTTAMMAEPRLLSRILSARMRRKVETHRMESGPDGVTRRVQSAGLRVLVVDRSGAQFEVQDWPESETFWQGGQGGLLVADNQTQTYEQADAERRRLLSTYAWGERAAPSPPAG